MADFTPRTRSESFLNGEDLEPITRREHFYAGRENELPEGHQEPETREEWFIKKYRGGGGGDITVESLSVTSNGTYTAPSGKAYSPVNVNVPLPSNAYLLQTIEHESIATFTDGTDNFVKSLEVAIEPVQSGSGEPSPTNIRPISGWDECKVTVADDLENPTVSNVYTIDLDGTRYGGKLDVVNGVLTVDRYYGVLAPTSAQITVTNNKYITFPTPSVANGYTLATTDLKCDKLKTSNYSTANDNHIHFANAGLFSIFTESDVGSTAADWVQWFEDEQITVCYKLATPLTIQLTPTIIKSLQGDNNFFASTGEIIKLQYWGEVS